MQGMGAICCDGVEACTAGSFSVQDGECQSDVCCSGNRSCEDSVFFGFSEGIFIRNQRCDGIDACKGGESDSLSGDLTCNGMGSCEDRPVKFISTSNVRLTHAITCTGENACRCTGVACDFAILDLAGVAWCQGIWVKTS